MGLVDYEKAWLELKRAIGERPSHGASALLAAMSRLEVEHAVDETAEAAVLRHFEGHLTDSFFGLLPAPATRDPLASMDLPTMVAMDNGATPDQPTEGNACPPQTHQPPSPSSSVTSLARRASPPSRPMSLAAAKR